MKIAAKTSKGISDYINISNVIMQGGVFGRMQCITCIDKLAKEVYSWGREATANCHIATRTSLHTQRYSCVSSSRGWWYPNSKQMFPTASALNATVNSFFESKKLKLSYKKCCAIQPCGKCKQNCPDLKVHGEKMHRQTITKYLGDVIFF